MSFTVAQVQEALENYSVVKPTWDGKSTYTEEWDWSEAGYESGSYTLTIDGEEVKASVVDSEIGGEGHGEYCYIVLKVGDQLFRQEGYYASHYGTDWDGSFEEVEAFEKTVTDYRRVK